jgi:molecular chaperone DnaJ
MIHGDRGQVGDLYEVLGIPRDADATAIKRAYRDLARRHHPDINEDKAAAEQNLSRINAAYKILRDPERRARYDSFGYAAAERVGAETIASVFDMFFGSARGDGGPGRRIRPFPGKDLRFSVEVSPNEAQHGTERDISSRHLVVCGACSGSGADPETTASACSRCRGTGNMRQVRQTRNKVQLTQTTCTVCSGKGQVIPRRCKTCGGLGRNASEQTLRVTVPAGVEDGSVLLADGAGEAGAYGGRSGDMYVYVAVKRDGPVRREALVRNEFEQPPGHKPLRAARKRLQPRSRFWPGMPLPFRFVWSAKATLAALGVIVLVVTAAILYATHLSVAVQSTRPVSGERIAVCAMPSAQQLASDLVNSYASKTGASNRYIITAQNAGVCDIRFSIAPGNADAAIARDGIVAIVNPANAVTRLSVAQLRAIFSGAVHDWSELGGPPGAIVPLLPDAASPEARALESSLFTGLSFGSGVMRVPSSADVTRLVSGADRVSRNAIGFVAFSQAVPAKMIPVADFPAPSVLSIASSRYPFTLAITLQSESQRNPAARQQLADFARTRDGLATIQEHRFVSPQGF